MEQPATYSSRDLSVVGYANGFTLWHYRSYEDTLETTMGPEYFTGSSVNTADFIFLVGIDGGRTGFVSYANKTCVRIVAA
jgi:hypothetical protein